VKISVYSPSHRQWEEQVEVKSTRAAHRYARRIARVWGVSAVHVYYLLKDGTHRGRDADDVISLD